MPKCIVDYCHNYAGMRRNYANVILHGFPTTLDRIKTWLRSLERGGQVFDNLEEMAAKIQEGKKHDSYRVCSEHFSKQCYIMSGEKKVLNKNALPTVFMPCGMEPRCGHRPEPLSRQMKAFMKRKATEDPPKNSRKAKVFCKDSSKSVQHGEQLTEIVLNLTLEIIYLLTGEDYALVKKSQSPIREPPAHPRINEKSNEERILKLTNRIIELLTREVPIRCEDITVYFSMEEWEYIKGHKDLYKGVVMDDHRTLTSPGVTCDQIKSLLRISCSNCAKPNTSSNSGHQKSPCLKTGNRVKEAVDDILKAPNSCDEKEVSEAEATYEHLSTMIKEEGSSSDGGTFDYTHTNHIRQYPSTRDMAEGLPSTRDVVEGLLSSWDMVEGLPFDGNVLPDANMYTPVKGTENCPSSRIKDGESVTYPGTYIPTNPTVHNPCDGDSVPYLGPHIPTDPSPHNPCDGDNVAYPGPYIPTYHPPPHIKVERTFCEAESTSTNAFYTPAAHTPHNPPPPIKVESIPCEAENSLGNAFYTPTDPPQCTSTHIKEELVSDEEGELTDPNVHTPANYLQHPYPYIKEEVDTYDATATNTPTGHRPQSPSTHIKENLVSSEDGNVIGKTLPFLCMECPEGFTSKSDLAYHQTIHRIEKLKCPECGKYFSNKSNLSNHIRSHTGEKPYSCPACGKRFTRKSTLIIHQRIHTGEKPFVCLECGRCFPGKGNLMKHQKVHKANKTMTAKTFVPMPMALIVDSTVPNGLQ